MTDARRIDLHAHTIHSDGTMTPTELVETAAGIGLAALAVTDHDTTAGLPEARETGKRVGIDVLDGCEISATIPTGVVHVLSYDFDEAHDGLQALLRSVREGREERNRRIFERLTKLKLPLEEEHVTKFAHGEIVARPHFAMAMVEQGYVDDIREAFSKYLYDGGPAYARAEMPAPEVAISTVKAAGGFTVLAHPKSLKLGGKDRYRPVIESFREAGLSGVEVDHPSQNPGQRQMFAELTAELGLVASGGSDFHGSAKPHLQLGEGDGSIHVTYETWNRLAAHARS